MPKLIQLKDKDNNYIYPIIRSPDILYEGSLTAKHTLGNYTYNLSADASKYKYFDIYCCNNDDFWSFVRVYQPNGKKVNVVINNQDSMLYWKNYTFTISGTKITEIRGHEHYSSSGSTVSYSESCMVVIRRIEGYK